MTEHQWLRPETGGARWSVWTVPQKAQTHNRRCTFPGALIDPHRGRWCGAEGGTRRSSQAGTRRCKPRAIRQALTSFSTNGGQARATRHAHSTVTKQAAKAAQRGCHGGHARGRRRGNKSGLGANHSTAAPPRLRFAFPLLTATSAKYLLAPGPSLVCFGLQCVLLSAARPTQSDSHESVQLTTCTGTTRHDLGTDNLRRTVKTSDSRIP